MLVKVYVTNSADPLVFPDADNVDITPTGYLRISSSGSKDKPGLFQVGGVSAALWTYYEVVSDPVAAVDDTSDSGVVTP